ncbi:MMPL family transporter [Nocardia puris]|uniref:RND superfamily putative drug exporter n=1 Tax=Nocardia puris TaxID=208602 RepID=A0A366E1P6_9NOCA|nr:MMPL family transporter [Nocardia puris]RBO96227.1 RND superfamily putative drug exporter [Nocardia puris]
MSVLLHRLGRWCFRRRGLTVFGWLAVIALAGVAAATLSGPTSDSFTVPGTEAQEAVDLAAERFPELSAGGATATVVLAAPEGARLTESEHRATVERVRERLASEPSIVDVGDPFTSAVTPDERMGLVTVSYRDGPTELTDGDRKALTDALTLARDAGLTAEVGGPAVAAPEEGVGEVLGIVVAAVVLLITLGSLVAAGMPLVVAGGALAVALSGIAAASGFTEMAGDSSMLALMLGTAVAIDYSLFIILRYRQLAADGYAPEEAAGQAMGRAGTAVFFAGMTVVVALAGLTVVGIPALTQVGLAAAFAVAMAVPAALTLLPALLGFAGARVLRGVNRRTVTRAPGRRWAEWILSHRIPVLVGGALVLLLAALPALDLRLGFPDDGTAPADTTQRRAYDLISDSFGPGHNGPLTILVDAPGGDAEAAAARATELIHAAGPVAGVAPPVLDASGRTALLGVIPETGPTTTDTEALIHDIRAAAASLPGMKVLVTGQTALDIDASDKLGAAMIPYLAVVGGLAFVLLVLVFRSLLVPLVAAVGFLLSVAATFGVVVAVFQWGWFGAVLGLESSGIIVNLLPVVLIGLVFGLAMDYQVFLVTRMREEHQRGASTDAAVVEGFAVSARVVTAAALIMISVFAGFLLSPTPMVQSVGFALAAAVFFDAFIVRMTLVPAAMSLLGKAGWWLPGWLDRILPEVDVEGSKLDDRAEVAAGGAAESEMSPIRS